MTSIVSTGVAGFNSVGSVASSGVTSIVSSAVNGVNSVATAASSGVNSVLSAASSVFHAGAGPGPQAPLWLGGPKGDIWAMGTGMVVAVGVLAGGVFL